MKQTTYRKEYYLSSYQRKEIASKLYSFMDVLIAENANNNISDNIIKEYSITMLNIINTLNRKNEK